MMIPMITNTGENEGRAVVHEDGSKGKLGKTFADESFEVIFDDVRNSAVVQSLMQLKGCIASGFPVVFGFTVYDSFEIQQVAQTRVVPLPAPSESVAAVAL